MLQRQVAYAILGWRNNPEGIDMHHNSQTIIELLWMCVPEPDPMFQWLV